MKSIFTILALVLLTTAAAQDIPSSNVPDAVFKAFKLKFPRTSKVDWELKGNEYEAEFYIDKKEYKAIYSPSGKLLRYKGELKNNELPTLLKKAISNQFKGYRIDEAERVEKNGRLFYQVKLEGAPRDEKVIFNSNGTVAAKETWW
jgi:uncharacterized membrane protein YkoI